MSVVVGAGWTKQVGGRMGWTPVETVEPPNRVVEVHYQGQIVRATFSSSEKVWRDQAGIVLVGIKHWREVV